MKKVCYIVAMMAEAKPFIEAYNMQEEVSFFAPLPCRLFRAQVQGMELCVVLNGEQHGSSLVGCEAASVATLATIEHLHPDLVINSGTCGGFKARNAHIADVYIGNGVMFHDRRVPGDDAWSTQSIGNYAVWDGSTALAQALSLKMDKVTTGSSLDMQPCDLQIIEENGGGLKDMEGAAVGFVCSLLNVPVLYVKSVTDLCDGGQATFDEFSRNLKAASEALREVNERVIAYLAALC